MLNKTVMALLLGVLLLSACSSPAEQKAQSQAAEAELSAKRALSDFFAAVDKRDWERVEQLIASDFEFYTDDSTTLNREEFIKAMKEDDMKIAKFELKDLKISLSQDQQMAWAKYHAYMESSVRGQPYNMMSAETVALRREGGYWKLTHNHASIKRLNDNALLLDGEKENRRH